MEEITTNKPEAIVCFVGDLNQLRTDVLENELGMIQTVKQPTHADRILDKFFTNRPDISEPLPSCRIADSEQEQGNSNKLWQWTYSQSQHGKKSHQILWRPSATYEQS